MPEPRPIGVGSPAVLHLHEFGRVVYTAFGVYPHHVGSSLRKKKPRDIDMRLMLPHSRFVQLFPDGLNGGTRWAAYCMAFSALGEKMTGLPIDFQIQYAGLANRYMDEPRLEIGRD